MARTNYSFEKRQRELAKKKKKEEKLARKAAGKDGQPDQTPETDATVTGAAGTPPSEGTGT